MPSFETRLLQPTVEEVTAALVEAAKQANYRCRIGKLERDESFFRKAAVEANKQREGFTRLIDPSVAPAALEGNDRATLVGLAWWTDPLGRKHWRIVGRRLEPGNDLLEHRFGPLKDKWPGLCVLCPERTILRRRGRKAEVLVLCSCGVCGTPEAVGWMGSECAACHDRREEGTQPPRAIPEAFIDEKSPQGAVAYSAKGETPITLGFDSNLRFRNLKKGTIRRDLNVNLWMGSGLVPFPIACNGRKVIVLGYDESFICNAVTGQESDAMFTTMNRGGAIALSADGGVFAQSDEDAVQVIALSGDGDDRDGFRGDAYCLAFSPDGQLLAAGQEEELVIRQWPAKKTLRKLTFEEDESPRSVAFDRKGEWVLIGVGASNAPLDSMEEFEPPPNIVPVPRSVYLWDLKTFQMSQPMQEHLGTIFAVAFSPGDQYAVSAGQDGRVIFWDLKTNKQAACFEAHLGSIYSMTFSPDGDTLATAGTDGTIRLWPWRELLDA